MTFPPSPNRLVGALDARSRPTLRVGLQGASQVHSLLCTLDTGCDDALVFADYEEATNYGLHFNTVRGGPRHDRLFADGRFGVFVQARATLHWLEPRSIIVLAPDPQRSRDMPPVPPDCPRILIGLPLLQGCRLTIAFDGSADNVVIEPLAQVPPR